MRRAARGPWLVRHRRGQQIDQAVRDQHGAREQVEHRREAEAIRQQAAERRHRGGEQRLSAEQKAGGAAREIGRRESQLCTTGRTANSANPSTDTAATTTTSLSMRVMAAITSVVTLKPASTTGRLPMRSDQVPATGAATTPPSCMAIMATPIHTGPVPSSLTRNRGRNRRVFSSANWLGEGSGICALQSIDGGQRFYTGKPGRRNPRSAATRRRGGAAAADRPFR